MTEPITPESIAVIRSLFFGRLAQSNRELIEATNDFAQAIDVQNHRAVLGIIAELENRMQLMHNIVIVLRECLEG